MADFNFITNRIATGAAINTIADVQQLINNGITHIIDCRDDFDDSQLLIKRAELSYLWNGTPDDGTPKSTEWFKKSLDFALPMFLIPRTKVYCHCQAGINRGPSTAYCIMIALGFNWSWCRAEIIAKRPLTVIGVRYADDAEKAIKALGYYG